MKGDLLFVFSYNMKPHSEERIPLMMEFAADPRLTPVLVTSTRATLWVSRIREGIVRAAVRENVQNIGEFFSEVVDQVATMGVKAKWGNVHPFSQDGLEKCIEYLRSYDLEDLHVLLHPDTPLDFELPEGVEFEDAHWLEPNCYVVVPKDRDFVGFLGRLGSSIVSVVHNAARGIGVARG